MKINRPYVLTIAGFDPSAGAGVLADVKTFENNETYGMGVVSALTYQNDIAFEKVEWMSVSQMIEQIEVLQKRFDFGYIKIGLIQNLETLNQLISHLISHISHLKIIWDPILKASAGFEFHKNVNGKLLEDICKQLYLITPNIPEALQLGSYNDAEQNAVYLSKFCNVYLKGGHDEKNAGRDILYLKDNTQLVLEATQKKLEPKHGSGCVLSSAITANLAKGMNLGNACSEAKKYVSAFLASNNSLLGYHKTEQEVFELKK